MDDGMIPEDVTNLLRGYIESFEQLEIMLLLHRTRAESSTTDAVASALNLSPDAAATALEKLSRVGLAELLIDGGTRRYRCRQGVADLEATLHKLAEVYEENRLDVIKLMNKNAIERVRTSAMRAFSDAFFVGGGGKKKDG
jgi:DNA-binding transcriptional ArsR family regulator